LRSIRQSLHPVGIYRLHIEHSVDDSVSLEEFDGLTSVSVFAANSAKLSWCGESTGKNGASHFLIAFREEFPKTPLQRFTQSRHHNRE
jgi:hypothetical protein